MDLLKSLLPHWEKLYQQSDNDMLKQFVEEVETYRSGIRFSEHEEEWYKDAIIYSLYVDLFNSDFNGLIEKLYYLQDLGVNCLWLLPILDSPMRDAGFDIRNYDRIRADLMGLTENFTKEQCLFRFIH